MLILKLFLIFRKIKVDSLNQGVTVRIQNKRQLEWIHLKPKIGKPMKSKEVGLGKIV